MEVLIKCRLEKYNVMEINFKWQPNRVEARAVHTSLTNTHDMLSRWYRIKTAVQS